MWLKTHSSVWHNPWKQPPHIRCLLLKIPHWWRQSAQNSGIASEWLLYCTSCIISLIIFVCGKMADSINCEISCWCFWAVFHIENHSEVMPEFWADWCHLCSLQTALLSLPVVCIETWYKTAAYYKQEMATTNFIGELISTHLHTLNLRPHPILVWHDGLLYSCYENKKEQ